MGRSVLTLAVTSSTSVVGVAIVDGGDVLSSRHVTTDRRHAEELTPMIAAVLDEAGVSLADMDRLAVDIGPGRFTGLRVGIATVRTLALAADLLVVPVSSLEALARSQVHAASVVAVIDARRSEVFQQRFGPDGPVSAPVFGPPAELSELVADGDVVVGDGADRYPEYYRSGVVADVNPSADVIAALSADREAQPGPTIMPLYLRDPDVQINIKTRNNT